MAGFVAGFPFMDGSAANNPWPTADARNTVTISTVRTNERDEMVFIELI